MPDLQSAICNRQVPVAIIGGGITGLTAAWELQKAGIPYMLLEKSERFGGKIQTDHIGGVGNAPFIIERAGDAFLAAQKPWAMELAYELGLDDEILTTNPVQPSVYILKDGTFVPIPAGLQLIIPTNREAFLASPLMSEDGKARALAEATIDPVIDPEDESVADFVRRRLGDEAVEMLAEPLLSGIYSAHPEEQSLLATFPRFRQLEQRHGSLIGGAKAAAAARQKAAQERAPTNRPQTAFISFKNGTEVLVKELAGRLTGDVRLNTSVGEIYCRCGFPYRTSLNRPRMCGMETAPTNCTSTTAKHFRPTTLSLLFLPHPPRTCCKPSPLRLSPISTPYASSAPASSSWPTAKRT